MDGRIAVFLSFSLFFLRNCGHLALSFFSFSSSVNDCLSPYSFLLEPSFHPRKIDLNSLSAMFYGWLDGVVCRRSSPVAPPLSLSPFSVHFSIRFIQLLSLLSSGM